VARTRQKAKQRKAKRLAEEERLARGTTGPNAASNPGEQAVVEHAEAFELGDVLEESGGDAEAAVEKIDEEDTDAGEAIKPVRGRTRTKEPEKAPEKRPAARPQRREGRARPARAEQRREPRQRGRVINFLVQVWAELRRVQWPDRTQVTQATAVVVVFCFLAGLYLAFFDWVFKEFVKVLI
jgi:preprotein translocase subunit SecE